MDTSVLQLRVVAELKSRIGESASCCIGPTGHGLADVFAILEDENLVKALETLAKSDEGRAALIRLGEVAIAAYLQDLTLDMDQGLTPLGFSCRVDGTFVNVSSAGMFDYWGTV